MDMILWWIGTTLLAIYSILISIILRRRHHYVIECLKLRSEKKQFENDLSEARAKVVETTKMAALGEMAGGIAHEINNPLAIIRSYNGVFQHMLKADQVD